MKKIGSILLGFLLLGSLCIGAYFILRTLWTVQEKLNPNVTAAIVASLAAVAGAIYTQRHSRLREIAESHRDQKVKLYEVYMDIIGPINLGGRASYEALLHIIWIGYKVPKPQAWPQEATEVRL